MSLDNIQLSKVTCKNLFAKNLVEMDQKEENKEINICSLGENQQQILFLVNEPEHKFLPNEEMTLLSNLITACKLSMADIGLVNFYKNHFDYHDFANQFHSKKILLFGVTTEDLNLPFTIPFFQIQQFQDQQYLTAPPLKIFLNNKDLKKELWTSLQKLFLKK
ncbi:MAG: hypothetical protein ABI148_01280 [Ginsengibacter sp.]